ncbi:hypothetical protein HOD38_05640 [archaeon]|jgi:hypothetical protein|nr:hypothetical protein [archaeon]MBT4397724.1 hypothetical protein [archaeon]
MEVMFYLYDPTNPSEVDTPVFRSLIERAETVFVQMNLPDIDAIDKLEEGWRKYVKTGILTPDIIRPSRVVDLIAQEVRGTDKKLALERALIPEYDIGSGQDRLMAAFLTGATERAKGIFGNHLELINVELDTINLSTTQQIINQDGPVLVVYGYGNLELVRAIADISDVELNFPEANYPIPYQIRAADDITKSEGVDVELYQRTLIERLANGLGGESGIRGVELARFAHFYANMAQPSIIERFPESYQSIRQHLVGIQMGTIVESFFTKNHLPSVEEVLDRIKKDPTEGYTPFDVLNGVRSPQFMPLTGAPGVHDVSQ